MNKTHILTLLALSALVIGAVATPVTAHAGDDRAAHHREAAEQHREQRGDHRGGHDVVAEFCSDEDNLTEREQERCDRIRSAHEPGHEARRAGHALVKAIDAHYARVGKLEMKEYEAEQRLADGNLSANDTERLEHALVVIQAQQNKTLDRIAHLEERLGALQAKWSEVEEHVREQRAKRGAGEDAAECAAEHAEELAEAEEERDESLAEAAAERDEDLAEAAAERDAVLSDPNATEEERAEAEEEYNATATDIEAEYDEEIAEAHAEYDEEIAEIEAEHQECLTEASEESEADPSDDADESDDDSQEESDDESEEESEDEADDES